MNRLAIPWLLWAAACSGDGNTDQTTGLDPVTVACESLTCDGNTEYCLLTYVNEVLATTDCPALPEACTGCGCAQDDALEQFEGATNCSSLISCAEVDGAIRVECYSSL